MASIEPSRSNLTFANALPRYFAANGLPADGGYEAKWVSGMFGPVPFAFPNVEARRRAVRYHDLHHVLTEYGTDGVGEGEISAWELASGCSQVGAALYLNLLGAFVGFCLAPARIRRAFLRGRRSRNFYRDTYSAELLARDVASARSEMLPPPDADLEARATAADRRAIALWLAGGGVFFVAHLALLCALAWLVIRWVLN